MFLGRSSSGFVVSPFEKVRADSAAKSENVKKLRPYLFGYAQFFSVVNPSKAFNPNRKIALALSACLLVAFSCTPTFALDRDRKILQFHHTTWSESDGAPSEISALAQTEDGYLWI